MAEENQIRRQNDWLVNRQWHAKKPLDELLGLVILRLKYWRH